MRFERPHEIVLLDEDHEPKTVGADDQPSDEFVRLIRTLPEHNPMMDPEIIGGWVSDSGKTIAYPKNDKYGASSDSLNRYDAEKIFSGEVIVRGPLRLRLYDPEVYLEWVDKYAANPGRYADSVEEVREATPPTHIPE